MKYLLLLPTLVLFLTSTVSSHADMDERIHDAIKIVEKRQGSDNPIPTEILQHARGFAICTISKGGIGIGGQGGDGIVVIRHNGAVSSWRAPSAFSISGASLGAQLGFSTIRYIIVLNSDDAVRQFIGQGKMKWDATATGTAGGDTGVEGESTQNLEKRAIIVYRDSGGIFGGATFGGSTIEVNNDVNRQAYGEHIYVRDILEGKVPPPRAADRLYSLLDGKR